MALSGSSTGVNYQLHRGASPIGSVLPGSGSSIDFGMQVVAGTYTVIAKDATTACQASMAASAIVSINPLPAVNTVTGGGGYCTGGTGVHVGLNGSVTGITYQLYNSSMAATGSAVPGTGSALDFGLITAADTYYGCSN